MPHEQRLRQPCAFHLTQTLRDNGDNLPSCDSSLISTAEDAKVFLRLVVHSSLTFYGKTPSIHLILLWGSGIRPGHRAHLDKRVQVQFRFFGDNREWCRRACLSPWTPLSAQWTKLYARKHV